ncbi:amidohydrolase [Planococcus sp. CPCC 101016]|uniref:M20 metallopeptidase family protein n=1 Tax=Planococcus sp. CPCC 101016 TaxID=2599617 RepID=UPI0011B68FC4|nr:M20 family metallopeptidase [Planococcus sp. CPCC 101016]TWT05213.1 amidohydrolase [Planococcus sp. CPCC 101016]
MPEQHLIVEQANSMTAKLVEWRRTFHRYPELSFQEFGTAQYIAGILQEIDGIEVDIGIGLDTSVVGTLTAGEGMTIAIRADIDALPIEEENETEYRSQNKGIMHACGHDAHPAIVLGTAEILAEQFKKMDIRGTVKFIFQPAEECIDERGMSGSPYLIQAGVYEGVDAAIAVHMCPWLPVGEVQVNDGCSMANVDVFRAKIMGTGGHGAYPELGTDPTWMLGPVLQALHGIVSRKVPALEAAVVSVGQIHAGTASNIIPTEVKIEGTMRSYSSEIRELLSAELKRAFSIAKDLDGEYSLEIQRGEPALVNSQAINEKFLKAMSETYPDLRITKKPFGMGGEDFGYVTQKLPGSMFFLGSAFPDGNQRDLHTPIFDIDESCLPIGTAILAQTALNFLTGKKFG